MKTKILGGAITVIITATVILNISISFSSDKSYNLKLENLDARASREWNIDIDGAENKTILCNDGKTEVRTCEYAYNQTCEDWDENSSCTNYGGDSGSSGKFDPDCAMYGHRWGSTSCTRCGIKTTDPGSNYCRYSPDKKHSYERDGSISVCKYCDDTIY